METLRRYGLVDPKPGDSMLARFGPGPKGLMAAEVRPLEGTKIHAPH
jgi:CspA family cold shock protein